MRAGRVPALIAWWVTESKGWREPWGRVGRGAFGSAPILPRCRCRWRRWCGSCLNFQTETKGRPSDIADPKDIQRFHDAGAHDIYCPEVVGRAARWAAEIVEEHGLG